MHDDDPHAAANPMCSARRARLSLARQDLDSARDAKLDSMDVAGLVLLVERLRGSLDDVIRLVDEVTSE
ncbi:hypothetical protein [Actinacidiphila glaucinigra]|uniref:hypothetical protein n=1 Tax=Actinacidiphila glaucinigra TaxID=235986 RepID=UPI0035D7DA63